MIEVCRYTPTDRSNWDNFVHKARNSSFMFLRDFMEYHQHRFTDHSLIIQSNGDWVALLPANIDGTSLKSHGGLTYGGLIIDDKMSGAQMLKLWEQLIAYLKSEEVTELIYKALPHIYHTSPSEEDLYALFRVGGKLWQRHLSTTIDYRRPIAMQTRRRRGYNKAKKAGYQWGESDELDRFWEILEANLKKRHGVSATHSREEMAHLKSKFPNNIRLFLCTKDKKVGAGVVVFENSVIAHLQYIAASEQGRDDGALDFLITELTDHYAKTKWYFDFGVSTPNGGRELNEGLLEQKEGFGGRSIAYDIYKIAI